MSSLSFLTCFITNLRCNFYISLYLQPSSLTAQGGSVGKESACEAGDARDANLILGSGRSLGERHGNPLQYSCLENPMDRGALKATVHRGTKSQT